MPTQRHSTSLPGAGTADSYPDPADLGETTPAEQVAPPGQDPTDQGATGHVEPAPTPGPRLPLTTNLALQVDGASVQVVPGADRDLGHGHGHGVPAGATAVLLHGAGSGTDVPVLQALREFLVVAGVDVASVEMPYRVAGRRAPDRPARLDAVLRATVAALGNPRPLVLAGRSMGARVACRCAADVGARGVLALGFPLTPPGSRPSRLPELLGAGAGVLVVQGDRDSFGMPDADPERGIAVHVVTGADHSLRRRKAGPGTSEQAVAEAAAVGARWLLGRLTAQRESATAASGFH